MDPVEKDVTDCNVTITIAHPQDQHVSGFFPVVDHGVTGVAGPRRHRNASLVARPIAARFNFDP